MSSMEETAVPPPSKEEEEPKEEEPKEEEPKDKESNEEAPKEGEVNEEEEPADEDVAASAMKVLHGTKVEGGKKSVWQMTMETFGMADGKHKKDDIIANTVEEALSSLEAMVEEAKDMHPKWQFTLTPLEEFQKTVRDVLLAFACWAQKEDEETINVSKAFRRLDSYVTWMEDHRTELEEPLTVDSVRAAALAWQVKLTHDKLGRMVWWIDMGAMDNQALKKDITPTDSIRYVVWQSHLLMFDKQAQENGIIVVEAMGDQGMIATMTILPMEVGTKLDRLTIGVLPIKLKVCYIFNYRKWLAIMMGIMKPFMSKKMRQRIVTIPAKSEPQKVLEEALGKESIPVGFSNLEGKMEDDIVFGNYIK